MNADQLHVSSVALPALWGSPKCHHTPNVETREGRESKDQRTTSEERGRTTKRKRIDEILKKQNQFSFVGGPTLGPTLVPTVNFSNADVEEPNRELERS